MVEADSYTYQLEPRDNERFLPAVVKRVVEEVLNQQLDGQEYDSETAQPRALEISDIIK